MGRDKRTKSRDPRTEKCDNTQKGTLDRLIRAPWDAQDEKNRKFLKDKGMMVGRHTLAKLIVPNLSDIERAMHLLDKHHISYDVQLTEPVSPGIRDTLFNQEACCRQFEKYCYKTEESEEAKSVKHYPLFGTLEDVHTAIKEVYDSLTSENPENFSNEIQGRINELQEKCKMKVAYDDYYRLNEISKYRKQIDQLCIIDSILIVLKHLRSHDDTNGIISCDTYLKILECESSLKEIFTDYLKEICMCDVDWSNEHCTISYKVY